MKNWELEGQPAAQMEDIYSSNKTVCTRTHTHTHTHTGHTHITDTHTYKYKYI